jgi:ABC-type branched-subunit amino acid transport system substrate-binding protein
LVVADDQTKADVGAREIERLIDQQHVVAVGGVISSDVGLATARTAERSKVPLFLVKAGAGNIPPRRAGTPSGPAFPPLPWSPPRSSSTSRARG